MYSKIYCQNYRFSDWQQWILEHNLNEPSIVIAKHAPATKWDIT